MIGKAFHIIISKDKVLLSWGSQQSVPYRMASDMEKDRLIARILHKILNLRLSIEEAGVLGKDEFRVLGGTLFKLLFSDEAFKLQFQTFYREALGSPEERYRLVLEFEKDTDEMAMLPWEYLFYEDDEVQEAFLGAHPKKCIDLVRKLPFKGNWLEFDKAALQIESPLRILLIAANPDTPLFMDELQTTLDYFQNLETRFAGQVQLSIIYQPELDNFENQLKQAMPNGFPHVVHFVGRGRLDGGSGQLCFVKRTADNKFAEHWVSDDVFAGYFEEWRQLPHLVVLHVCDSTPIVSYKEERGTAIRLAKKGVPFVLALQNPVPEWMGQMMMEKIYDNLLGGMDISAALTEGRFFLARKLIDAKGRKYDNYEHKAFGSIMLFTSVLEPFMVGAPRAIETPIASTNTGSANRNTPSPITITKNVGEMTPRVTSPSTTASVQVESARTSTSTAQSDRTQTNTLTDALQKERAGLEEELTKLIEKLNFYRVEYVTITDLSMKFDAQDQIKKFELQVEQIKIKLGIVRDDRAG